MQKRHINNNLFEVKNEKIKQNNISEGRYRVTGESNYVKEKLSFTNIFNFKMQLVDL